MCLEINGKAQETSGRFDDSLGADESLRLGKLRGGSPVDGLPKGRFAQDDSPGQDTNRTDARERNSVTGKILQRLKLIEEKYAGYVDKHQTQLEAQLNESKSHRLELAKNIADLEQEIYNLVSPDQTQC